MNRDHAEALWQRAYAALAARDVLPEEASTLTPSELADRVGESGEMRLRELVDGYYYPARYGGARGTLTSADAEALVVSIEGRTSRAGRNDGAVEPSLAADGEHVCPVCRARPARRRVRWPL